MGIGPNGDLIVVTSSSMESTESPSGLKLNNVEEFEVFPNPVSELLTISSIASAGMTFTITNMVGKVVAPPTQIKGTTMQLDVSRFAPGLYLIRNNMGVTKKFIIQK